MNKNTFKQNSLIRSSFVLEVNTRYKMNKIVKKILLAGYKLMPEILLRETGFKYSTCGTFTKNKIRMQELKETGDSR